MPCIKNGRYANDFTALLLHLIAIIAIGAIWRVSGSVHKPVALSFFLLQEIIAVFAHIYYLIQYTFKKNKETPGWWNSAKWVEYGFSATAGTLGTFFAGVEPHGATTNDYIVMVVILCLGFSQQRIGYILDMPSTNSAFKTRSGAAKFIFFTIAFIFQIIENCLVIIQKPPLFITPIYVVMWSLFGIHCGIRLKVMYSQNVSEFYKAWKSDYWTELVYSYLGWTAKISVLLVALPDAFRDLSSKEIDAMYGVMVFLFVFTFSGLVIIKRTFTPSTTGKLLVDANRPNDVLL